VFGNLGNLADLMRNAGKIRESMERAAEQLGDLKVEGEAAGGKVKAVVNGRLELISVRIDPSMTRAEDVELLEDLITAAVNQALTKARDEATRSMASGLPVEGLGDLLSGPGAAPGPGGGTT